MGLFINYVTQKWDSKIPLPTMLSNFFSFEWSYFSLKNFSYIFFKLYFVLLSRTIKMNNNYKAIRIKTKTLFGTPTSLNFYSGYTSWFLTLEIGGWTSENCSSLSHAWRIHGGSSWGTIQGRKNFFTNYLVRQLQWRLLTSNNYQIIHKISTLDKFYYPALKH